MVGCIDSSLLLIIGNLVRFAHNWNVGIVECWPPAYRAYDSERIMGSKRHSAKGRE
jgi:hypothetical protein